MVLRGIKHGAISHDAELEQLALRVASLYESLSNLPIDTVRQDFKSLLLELTLPKIWDVYRVLMQKVVESGNEGQFADGTNYHDAAEYLLTFVSIPGRKTEQNNQGLDGVIGQSNITNDTHRELKVYANGRAPIIVHYRGAQYTNPPTT